MKFKLGKLPPRHDPRVPTLHRLMGGALLPAAPDRCAWNARVSGYGMLDNDQMGDCVVAWSLHQIQTWTAWTGKEVVPDADTAEMIYAEQSGYDPTTGANDNGLNVDDYLQNWMMNGIPAVRGGPVMKLDGYARLDPHDVRTLKSCIYWFGGVTAGLNLPGDAEQEFDEGQPWGAVGSEPVGGHCIGFVGYDPDYLYGVTWGDGTPKIQRVTVPWWMAYADEADALISKSWLKSDRTPSGLDIKQMDCEITALQGRLATVPV